MPTIVHETEKNQIDRAAEFVVYIDTIALVLIADQMTRIDSRARLARISSRSQGGLGKASDVAVRQPWRERQRLKIFFVTNTSSLNAIPSAVRVKTVGKE
jgi:hypothetical protein